MLLHLITFTRLDGVQICVCLISWLDNEFSFPSNLFRLPFSIFARCGLVFLALYLMLRLQIITIIKILEFPTIEMFKDTHFVLQKFTNPQRKHFGLEEKWTELPKTVEIWFTVSSQLLSLKIGGEKILQNHRYNQDSWLSGG